MTADYYELLGVDRSATADEIKRAFRRRARELHPDVNPDDPAAEAQFKEVQRAYEVLSDVDRRRRYDQFGTDDLSGADRFGAGGLGDIFDAFFGSDSPFGRGGSPAGPPRGADIEAVVDVSLEEAVFGARKDVSVRTAVACDVCEATGAEPGTGVSACVECGGSGQVRRVRQSILGQMVTAASCSRCGGLGQVIASPCKACRGEGRVVEQQSHTLDIRAGVDSGTTLRYAGRGAVGARGGGAGDLYVHIRVQDDPRFVRDGLDLVHDLSVSVSQAALGVRMGLETLDGDEEIVIEPAAQSGDVVRIRGRGVPSLDRPGHRGDLLIRLRVATPSSLTEEEEQLYRRLAEIRGEQVAPPEDGFFSRLRSAFR